MRYAWLAAAFAVTLVVGLLVGIILGGGGSGEQGSAHPPRTVTVEKTIPGRATPNPRPTTKGVGSLDEARAAFERAVKGFGNPDLEVTEVMEFANNYYAEVEEKDTGIGAMELLIGRPGGRVYQEPGPNMMWNTKYGMMAGGRGHGGMMGPNGGGMMGGYRSSSASASNPKGATGDEMPVGPDRAREIANSYLSRLPRHQSGGANEVLRLLHHRHREGRQDQRDAERQRLLGGGLVPLLARALHRQAGW
jgi:hypothetical protein